MTELERPMLYPVYWPPRLWRVRAPLAAWRAGVRLLRRLWQRHPFPSVPPRRTLLQRETERLEQRKAQLPWGPYL